MGTLVVMHYRTKMFGRLADHTYVRCGNGGRAWSCWGGKTGGAELRRGTGSTLRADTIAGANERAGITCYLINGVCHQAANRVLLPAEITVRGAAGYDVSEALFGTYGRPRGPFGLCSAPFLQYPEISGDLPACAEPPVLTKTRRSVKSRVSIKRLHPDTRERAYLKGVRAIYRKAAPRLRKTMGATVAATEPDLEEFQVELFRHKVDYHLRSGAGKSQTSKLEDIRRSAERSRMKIEEWFLRGDMTVSEFIEAFNKETILFQDAAAGVLSAAAYRKLFGTPRGEVFVLADPAIARRALPKTAQSARRSE